MKQFPSTRIRMASMSKSHLWTCLQKDGNRQHGRAAEVAVLCGASNVFRIARPTVLVEAEERHRRGAVASVMAHFAELGYTGFFLSGKRILPVDKFNPELHQRDTEAGSGARSDSYVNNFIFIPRKNNVACEKLLLSKRSPTSFL